MHLNRPRPFALKIRAGDVNLRARRLSSVDGLLDLEIGVRLQRSSSANRGDPTRQIETWKAEAHLAEDAIAHGIKHVVMHPDEARDDAIAMQIEHLRILRN